MDENRMITPARAVLSARALALSAVMCSCQLVAGIEDITIVDPGSVPYAVRGTAIGVREPVALLLESTLGSESALVSQDGPFSFAMELRDGDSFAVSITMDGEPACALGNASGTIDGADAQVALGCEDALLAALVISGPTAPDLGFVPAELEYRAEVSLLQQSTMVTATAMSPDATITIAGTEVASGQPSPPLPLALGDTTIDVVVAYPAGGELTYRVQVSRAAQLAQHTYAKASTIGVDDELGFRVAMSGDTIAVSAWLEDSKATGIGGNQRNNGARDSGAVFIFRDTPAGWVQEAYIKASNTEADDLFGEAIALDGDTLVVGAAYEDSAATGIGGNQADNGAEDSGAVYVFRRSGASWTQEAYIKSSNTGVFDYFGYRLALSGNVLAVGAPGEDSAATGTGGDQADNSLRDSGAVYIFQRAGTSWTQRVYLKSSSPDGNDTFGASLALSGDTLAVGVPGEDSAATGIGGSQSNNGAPDSGAVFIFRDNGTSWAEEAYVKASNTGAGDLFGEAVAVHGDTLAVGAQLEDSAATGVDGNQADESGRDSGAAYVFRRSGASWAQEAYIKASNTGLVDQLGTSVAVFGDTLAVGAPREDSAATGIGGAGDDDSELAAGAVYLYQRAGTAWSHKAYIKASNTGGDDYVGHDVALSGDTLAVGAPGEASSATGIDGNQSNDAAEGSGALYIFR